MQFYTWQYMPLTADTPTTPRTPIFAIAMACVLLFGFAAVGVWSMGQVAMVPSAVPPSLSVEGENTRNSLTADAHSHLRLTASGPGWREITEAQRQVLMPLRDRWDTIGALAKRRWLVLADRYPSMDESERNKLVSRMNTWANLSVQQRNQARINFESTKRLSAQELQSKWDEYQALSEAERKRLAEQARKAKTAKKSKRKLAQPPVPKPASAPAEHSGTTAPATVTTHPVATPSVVETIPVLTPQAAPSVHISPLERKPSVTSQPISAPQAAPNLVLPPMPAHTAEPGAPMPPHTPDSHRSASPQESSKPLPIAPTPAQ